MQEFVDLCVAAGINVARLELIDMYLIAGRIIQDFELFTKAIALAKSNGDRGAMLRPGLREAVLHSMTKADRWALRERVLGVVQVKKKT
jgi:hypothetical protein